MPACRKPVAAGMCGQGVAGRCAWQAMCRGMDAGGSTSATSGPAPATSSARGCLSYHMTHTCTHVCMDVQPQHGRAAQHVCTLRTASRWAVAASLSDALGAAPRPMLSMTTSWSQQQQQQGRGHQGRRRCRRHQARALGWLLSGPPAGAATGVAGGVLAVVGV